VHLVKGLKKNLLFLKKFLSKKDCSANQKRENSAGSPDFYLSPCWIFSRAEFFMHQKKSD
jgi:hypothetical protein